MALYRYRATDAAGHISKGEMDALNEFDLESQLKKNDLELIHSSPLKDKHHAVHRLARRDLINFLFQLEMLFRAGVPILAILGDLRDTAETPKVKNLCANLYEKIDSGSTISESFAANPGIFPELVTNLIRAGEGTGQLPYVLQEIVNSLKWQDELASKTKQLLMYPAFVTLVVGSVVVFLMTYLVPQIIGFVANMGGTIPLQTKLLIWVSDAFVKYWWIIVSAPFAALALLMLLPRVNLRFRRWMHAAQLRIPYIGIIIKKIILARVSDTLGLTYRTGIPVLDGLVYCGNITSNLVVKEAINKARADIANGAPISQGFAAQRLFPSMVIRMIKVGEETGDLAGSLKNISYFYNRDINDSISRVQALIEPTLTIVLGLILGWIMMAVLGPIYDTISKLKLS
ncbi:MAG: type II secretion system F family protein [Gallionellales bacterium CG03_land_8_20_14_0_80_55_15]|nr:MAG: type II secretion system F family protein [Gallionellales bacterium CG03_land_8_20_14_0_80_55_15]HCJ51585.1 type II secretion system F family protein [Gallionella sp.]